MAEVVHADVLKQILIRLHVEDLIRCKRVCKSWHTLITSPRFINRHLNRSYNEDRYNNELSSRRVRISHRHCSLVGSSNGLVCIISCIHSRKVLVGNPLTREVRQLRLPGWMTHSPPVCSGFGYDSSKDDYKLIVGAEKRKNRTCVQVLSLKSNVWRVIRELKYTFCTKIGILWNGALHWIVRDERMKMLIIAYDLSKEEFKEIPQPKGEGCLFRFSTSRLGIVKECLCIFGYACEDDVWIMEKYNVKQSWELLPRHHEWKRSIIHYLSLPKDESFFHHDVGSWFSGNSSHLQFFIDAPIFVESLVSP
ncbi:putative F-box domain, galactose oxidase/kelch, beta-propeller, F-box associated interaction [Helianthus annuus]|nr:putative F-box domain, galactose oxidase/kelch, beta-propeller, F-box associated interaction [Helianthus annuus]KAJ0865584.1 putative F-box domain, galactose oxidase/kelch, beta-propeller, F-box associated interaction [Helianthus annuus]